ncbi:hypothetical protein DFJ74DRAFT_624229, partial [Hyaloraphidium curvatum]
MLGSVAGSTASSSRAGYTGAQLDSLVAALFQRSGAIPSGRAQQPRIAWPAFQDPGRSPGGSDDSSADEATTFSPVEPGALVRVGSSIGPSADLQPLPPSSDLLRIVQDYFIVNNLHSQMKLVHYKMFFPSLATRPRTSIFAPNELQPTAQNGAYPPPLPLFLAMASVGCTQLEPSEEGVSRQLLPPAPFAEAPAVDIAANFGSPVAGGSRTRGTSHSLARHAWCYLQPWLERMGIGSLGGARARPREGGIDQGALDVLFALVTLLWRSGLFLRTEASRGLMNVGVALAYKMGCSDPASLLAPYPSGTVLPGGVVLPPSGIDLYLYYANQYRAESLRRAFWGLYIHDRNLMVLDCSNPTISDEVAWAMNLPCEERHFDAVSELLSAAEAIVATRPGNAAAAALDTLPWHRLPARLLGSAFNTIRCKGGDPPGQIGLRFAVIIAAIFTIGKAVQLHVRARELGADVFDPACDPDDGGVRKVAGKVRKMRARIHGLFARLPAWYVELDSDPAGFLAGEAARPAGERRSVDVLNGAFNDLFLVRLACMFMHGPLKPDLVNPSHLAWLGTARQTPNHLARIVAALPPLKGFPDLSGHPRAPYFPVFAVDDPNLPIPEVCLHHTLHLIRLIRAYVRVDPRLLRTSVLGHHAMVQAAVYRA